MTAAQVREWLGAYTYLAVFVGTLIDASGLPFPGRLLLMAAGAFAAAAGDTVIPTIALAAAAAILMDHVWYLASAWGSEPVLRLYRRLTGSAATENAADYVSRYGAATIILGRFFTVIRATTWPVAAARGLTYVRFLALDALGAVLWASTWVLLGSAIGGRWQSTEETAGTWLALIGAVLGAAILVTVVFRLWHRHTAQRDSPSSPTKGC